MCFLRRCRVQDAGKVDDTYANSGSVLLLLRTEVENRVPICSQKPLLWGGVLCVSVSGRGYGHFQWEWMRNAPGLSCLYEEGLYPACAVCTFLLPGHIARQHRHLLRIRVLLVLTFRFAPVEQFCFPYPDQMLNPTFLVVKLYSSSTGYVYTSM